VRHQSYAGTTVAHGVKGFTEIAHQKKKDGPDRGHQVSGTPRQRQESSDMVWIAKMEFV